jgi:hypothetical protein
MSETSTVLNEAFDTATEEGSSDFSPIPAGTYTAFIKKAEVETLKSGRGEAVRVQWEIEDGQYAGRIVFDRCIVSHESAPAMKFGRQKLKDICDATGHFDKLTDLTAITANGLLGLGIVLNRSGLKGQAVWIPNTHKRTMAAAIGANSMTRP